LLLCDAKAPNCQKNKAFKGLGHYSEWPKVADAVIKAPVSLCVLSTLAVTLHVDGLAALVHDEHMHGQGKRLVLNMRRLNDKIQARGVNLVIPPTHHGTMAANTGHEEWQDKALLQQAGEYRRHRALECFSPVGHGVFLPLPAG